MLLTLHSILASYVISQPKCFLTSDPDSGFQNHPYQIVLLSHLYAIDLPCIIQLVPRNFMMIGDVLSKRYVDLELMGFSVCVCGWMDVVGGQGERNQPRKSLKCRVSCTSQQNVPPKYFVGHCIPSCALSCRCCIARWLSTSLPM